MKDPFKEALHKPSKESLEFKKEVRELLLTSDYSKEIVEKTILQKVHFKGNKEQITLSYSPEMHSKVLSVWDEFLRNCYWNMSSYDPDNSKMITIFRNIDTLRSGIEAKMKNMR